MEDRLKRIYRDRREGRRWALQDHLTSAAYAFGGEEQGAGWKSLFDQTLLDEEKRAMIEAEEAAALEALAEDRKARLAAMGGGGHAHV